MDLIRAILLILWLVLTDGLEVCGPRGPETQEAQNIKAWTYASSGRAQPVVYFRKSYGFDNGVLYGMQGGYCDTLDVRHGWSEPVVHVLTPAGVYYCLQRGYTVIEVQ